MAVREANSETLVAERSDARLTKRSGDMVYRNAAAIRELLAQRSASHNWEVSSAAFASALRIST